MYALENSYTDGSRSTTNVPQDVAFYEDWKEIFGKDRANGGNAEDIYEAWNEMRKDDQHIPNEGTPVEKEVSFENKVNKMAYDQVFQSARDDQHAKKSSGQRSEGLMRSYKVSVSYW